MIFEYPFKEISLYTFNQVSALLKQDRKKNLLNDNINFISDNSCTHELNCSLFSGSYILDLIGEANSYHELRLNISIEEKQDVTLLIHIGHQIDVKYLSKIFGSITLQSFACCHILFVSESSNSCLHQFLCNINWILEKNSFLDLFIQQSSGILEHHQHFFNLKEHSKLKMRGMIITPSGTYKSIQPKVIHREPSAESDIIIKSLLQGPSKTSILGKIQVENGSQNIKGAYQNNNLMISNGAFLVAQPELDIDFDDIACSHGVTIGALDLQAFFYLQSRGLTPNEAKKILMLSFLKGIIPSILINNLMTNYIEDLETLLIGLQGGA